MDCVVDVSSIYCGSRVSQPIGTQANRFGLDVAMTCNRVCQSRFGYGVTASARLLGSDVSAFTITFFHHTQSRANCPASIAINAHFRLIRSNEPYVPVQSRTGHDDAVELGVQAVIMAFYQHSFI